MFGAEVTALDITAVVVQAVAAVAVAVTAWFAFKSSKRAEEAVEATRRATEASLLNELLREYSSPAFADALEAVASWYADYPSNAGPMLVEHLANRNPKAVAANNGRRVISHYFLRAWRLCGSGFLSEDALRVAARDQSGLDVLVEQVWPLEVAISEGPPDRTEDFRALLEFCDRSLPAPDPTTEADV